MIQAFASTLYPKTRIIQKRGRSKSRASQSFTLAKLAARASVGLNQENVGPRLAPSAHSLQCRPSLDQSQGEKQRVA